MISWSCGGGIQSVAIGVMVNEGVLPKPDFAGIADTGRECQSTWDYLDGVLNPYMREVGIEVERVGHELSRVDLYDKSGLTLIPAYTSEGRLSAFCSGEWKRDVMERWLRSKGVKTVTQWLGFSWDERHRCKKPHRDWCQLEFPLVDRMITRAGCEEIIRKAGLPLPKKTRCWMCPHMNNEEWREIKSNPEEWKKAVELEGEMNEMDPRGETMFLHHSRTPLLLADLGQPGDEIPPLFRGCQESGCFT